MRKPDPGIFDLVVAQLGVPAQVCVFIDDIVAYLEPACQRGMSVIHHTNSSMTISLLQDLFNVPIAK
jgi:putative hydrolase of the HAD superfamily